MNKFENDILNMFPFLMFFFSFSSVFPVRPLSVKLQGENRPLSANNSYELFCDIIGSRPIPTITWWKGSIQMRGNREMVSKNNIIFFLYTNFLFVSIL